jgi:hypothetical protein
MSQPKSTARASFVFQACSIAESFRVSRLDSLLVASDFLSAGQLQLAPTWLQARLKIAMDRNSDSDAPVTRIGCTRLLLPVAST